MKLNRIFRLLASALCLAFFSLSGAKVALPYTRRGLVAEHGLAWLLPRLIGPMNTADLLLSGRTIEAQEASQMGMALLKRILNLTNSESLP